MHTLRTNPEGAWRNKEANERLSDMQFILDIHQGETSWQVSVMEKTQWNCKETMTRIALKRPNHKSSAMLAAAVLEHNEMERVRGLSTTQWTLGNSTNLDQLFLDSGDETTDRDAWLKVHNEELFKRASRARKRPLVHFRPGEEWTSGEVEKEKGTRPHIKGRFHEGAVVLSTSTEIDEEDEFPKPRKVVWRIHARNLIKCAPEHLRYPS